MKMTKYSILTVIVCSLLLGMMRLATGQELGLVHHDSVTFPTQSAFKGKLFVHLPKKYSPTSTVKYPVIYVLDPEYRFAQTVIAMESLSAAINETVPAAIIIGIPANDRFYDFTPLTSKTWQAPGFIKQTGGADNFRKYLLEEVIPFVEKKYHAAPTRIIIGHSLGGLFALDLITKSPTSFLGYLILDPSTFWNNGEIIEATHTALQNLPTQVRMFLADGLVPEGMEVMLEPNQKRLEELLMNQKYANFRYSYKGLRGESHNEMPYQAIYLGIKEIFSDYKPEMPWKL